MPHFDFDAVVGEVEQEPITFTFRGEMYEIPAEIPYFTALRLNKILSTKKSLSDELAIEEMHELLKSILGDIQFAQLEHSRASVVEFGKLLEYIFNAYAATTKEDTSPKAPKRGKKAS